MRWGWGSQPVPFASWRATSPLHRCSPARRKMACPTIICAAASLKLSQLSGTIRSCCTTIPSPVGAEAMMARFTAPMLRRPCRRVCGCPACPSPASSAHRFLALEPVPMSALAPPPSSRLDGEGDSSPPIPVSAEGKGEEAGWQDRTRRAAARSRMMNIAPTGRMEPEGRGGWKAGSPLINKVISVT